MEGFEGEARVVDRRGRVADDGKSKRPETRGTVNGRGPTVERIAILRPLDELLVGWVVDYSGRDKLDLSERKDEEGHGRRRTRIISGGKVGQPDARPWTNGRILLSEVLPERLACLGTLERLRAEWHGDEPVEDKKRTSTSGWSGPKDEEDDGSYDAKILILG